MDVQTIIKTGNAEQAYNWGKDVGTHQDEMAEVIIKSGNPMQAVGWAYGIGTHKTEMAEVVIKSGNPMQAIHWAKNLGTHLPAMAEVIIDAGIKTGSAEYIYYWIQTIDSNKMLGRQMMRALYRIG